MGIFSKIKSAFNPKYEPLVCKPADILELLGECVSIGAPLCNLVIEINEKPHKIGVTSDYDSRTGKPFDIVFYLNGEEFPSLDELTEKAAIDGVRFVELETVTVLRDEEAGDPRGNALLEKREIR